MQEFASVNVATLGAQCVLGMSGKELRSLQVRLHSEPCRYDVDQLIARSNYARTL